MSAVAIVLALGGALVATRQVSSASASASIDRGLAATRAAIEDKLAARSQELRAVAERLVAVPSFLAQVESALEQNDRSTLLDAADNFRQQLNAEWALITDQSGVLQAWSGHTDRYGNDMSGGALVGYALQGASTEGIWLEPEEPSYRLYQAVGVPFRSGLAAPIGVLVAALPIDTALAQVLKRNTSSEVQFFTRDTSGMAVANVGTLARPIDLSRTLGKDTASARLDLGGADGGWVGTVAPLRTAAGDPVGGVVGLRSREAELAPYVRLQRIVTLGLIAGLLIALGSSAWLAGRITRPVSALVAATERVGAGDYEATVPIESTDEIGDLARAFQQMLEELREKQRLVEFLSAGGTVDLPERTRRLELPSAAPPPLAIGTTLDNRYELKELLGAGGMGVVYRALDRQLGETVALKVLHPAWSERAPDMIERFKQEIRLARRITHRNVVRTHDFGEVDGTYFITMEFVEGTTLDKLIARRGRMPVGATLTVGKQLCRALEVAHEAGVIHRDVKPANLVVDGAGFLKVMDFGIARLTEEFSRGKPGLTQAGSIIGSPDYMAPEQLLGEEVDHRVDIYATGCVLFECLTGHPVYSAPNLIALISRHLEEPVPEVRNLNPEVPPALGSVVTRAVAKDKNDRWPSAAALLEALDAIET